MLKPKDPICLFQFTVTLLPTHPNFFDAKGVLDCLAGFPSADKVLSRQALDKLLETQAMTLEGKPEIQLIETPEFHTLDGECAAQVAAIQKYGFFLSVDARQANPRLN